MSQKPTRRDFIKHSSALGLGAAWWVGNSTAYAFEDSKNPVERLNFACIGVGGKGSSDTDDAGAAGNIVALCDIDDNALNKKAAKFPKAKKYNDYRLMLEEMAGDIDAVTVATPDHSHAPASVMAMKLGKHVHCQKPLTWSMYEARRMRELAAEKKVATQMGNQGTAHNGLREAVEVIRSGALGKVSDVHVWTNRPVWPQGQGRPKETPGIPNNVHWYLFLGPAPERPYHPAYHSFKWRGWVDFGTGALGDMACHTANMAVMALSLFEPTSVVADTTGIVENETFPGKSIIKFEFPAIDSRPAVNLTWYDGGNKPPEALLQGEKIASSGSLIVGDKGTLYTPNDYGSEYVLLPKENYADFKKPEPSLPRSPGHFKEFAVACRGGAPAMSNFDYAGRLTETILLGNLALHVPGKKIEWDAKNLKATNAPELAHFISREYRHGWTL
ncbi:MAG: Gfo/Idh/MocA family protein [Planctomycetaceae bacterium]